MVGGDMAVQSFFIIAGFFTSLVLVEKYFGKKNSYFLFITKRLIKLYPIYCLVLIATLISIISLPKLSSPFIQSYDLFRHYLSNPDQLNIATKIYVFFINLFIVGLESTFYLGFNTQSGTIYYPSSLINTPIRMTNFMIITQAWFLALLIYFYLVSPFILKKKLRLILVIIIVTLIMRVFLSRMNPFWDWEPWNRRFFFTQIGVFLLGRISYEIYTKIRRLNLNRYILFVIYTILLLMIMIYYHIPNLTIYNIDVNRSMYTIFLTITIPFVFIFTRNNKLDRFLGELSYPIYITHVLIIDILQSYIPNIYRSYVPLFLFILLMIVSTILVKFLFYPLEAYYRKKLSLL